MWSFNRKKRDKEFLENVFSDYLEPKFIDKVHDNTSSISTKNNKSRDICYILILINQNDNFYNTMSKIIDYSMKQKAMIDTIEGIYIKLIYGGLKFDDEKDINILRKNYIDNFPKELISDCSIIHGECNCFVGNIGNNTRMNFTALLPNYKEKLSILINTEYGKIKELN